MVEQGHAVALFDWELCGEDHRDRLERLFGKIMPKISYVRCERPLVYEMDRLRRIVRDEKIDYCLYDSVAFATDGPPESAEMAGRYFRAVRQIGPGSLHIAHVTKGENGDQKPFGSVFWSNSARMTIYAKISDSSADGKTITLGLFPKKANLGQLPHPSAFEISFEEDRTFFRRVNPGDTPELAVKMTIRQRMMHILKNGSAVVSEIAAQLEVEPNSIYKTIDNNKKLFKLYEGGKVGILQRDSDSGQFSSK
jgi:hypothetical protein